MDTVTYFRCRPTRTVHASIIWYLNLIEPLIDN